jgi:5-hydroxyisourate hydrolase-like protein (transthyretin family)
MTTSLQLSRPRTRTWALALALSAGLTLSSCGDEGSDCGGPFCIGPESPQATTLKKGLGDGQQGAPGRELAQPIDVIVTDDDNRPIQDVVVRFSVGQGGGTLSETEIRSDVEGHARVNWTLGSEVGSQSAQATASTTGGSPLTGAPVAFSAQAVRPPPASLVIRQAPSVAARNRIQLEQQPVIDVLDGDAQPVPGIPVVAAIASGGGTLSGTTAVVSDASGRATYTDLALAGPSGPRILRFSVVDPALEVVSGTIILAAGGPAQLAGIAPLAYQGTVTSPVSPAPSVVVKDASGNGVPGISVSFTANRDARVSPETVATDQNGAARVTSWTLGSSATGDYTLTARIEGSALPAVRFTATARAGAAGRLAIVTQPSSPTQNGAPFSQQPVIQVTDQDGNPAPQANVMITATVSSGPNGGLQNATANTDATGRATFNGLTLTGTVGNYTISFSAEGLTGVTSSPITLTVGAPARLAIAVQPPANARSRAVLTPQPVIQVQDAGGNAVAQSGVAVTASVDVGTALGGLTTVTSGADGRASFTDLSISGSPGLKTLTFTSGALQAASAQVTLPSVSSVQLQTPAPASAQVGTALSNVPVWVLTDNVGQPVADAPFTLDASAGSSVIPVSGASGDNGVAQVQSWTLGTTAGDQYVEIKVGSALSSQVHVQATPAAPVNLLKISGDTPVQHAPPDSALADNLVVQVSDAFGNGVSGVTVQWRSCDGAGTFDQNTDLNGFSSARQPTGPQPGTYCASASASAANGPLQGSPVKFSYVVDPMTSSTSMLRSGRFGPAGQAPPPGPPRSQLTRPSTSR